MKHKSLIASFLLVVCVCLYAFRLDEDPFETLLRKISAYAQANPQEKVHLHLDKPYYAIGDNIWFKAYVLDNITDQPSVISNALYVELINEKDSVTKQIKLPLMSGVTWGDFKLTDTLPEGNYRLRAYTQLMRNAGPDYFFDKTIKIGNAWANKVFTNTAYAYRAKNKEENVEALIIFTDKQAKPYVERPVIYRVQLGDKTVERGKATTNASGEIHLSFVNPKPGTPVSGQITATITLPDNQQIIKNIPLKASSDAVSVQFFPESGNIIENLPSKIALKAVNAAGLGENITGVIVDNDSTEVIKFETTYLGMGYFTINPQPGKTYTARITLKNGSIQNVPLPKALPGGYILSVNNMDSIRLTAKMLVSHNLLNQGEMKLVVQHNNTVYTVLKTKPVKQVINFSIPKKELPSGIIRLTLFSADNTPVCERLVFINNSADIIDVNLQHLKPSYKHRENVALELSAKDQGKPTKGSFSVSVTNSDIIKPDADNESNILTSLLLTADLKGYVEKPNAYFQDNRKETNENLDNLMLTQGWTRISWKDLISGMTSARPAFQPEKSLKVSGTVTTTGGKPVAKGKVSLFSTSGGLFMIDTLTDDKGRFSFDNLIFGDSTKFVIQARNAKNKKYVEIKLDIVPGQVVTKNKNTGDIEVNVNEAILGYIQKSEKYFDDLTRQGLLEHSYILDQVNIVQKKNPAKYSANLNGAGNADAVITAKDLTACITLSQCLQGRVAGLILKNGIPYLMRNNGMPMGIMLDGVNVGGDFLDNISPFDVETIEVLKNVAYTAIYGSNGGGGLLVITTKRGGGDLSYSRYSPGIITYSPKGYYAVREFYSPQYTPENAEKGTDRRSTIYWTPQLLPEENGIAKFNFYNTDESGTYRVVIEGMNSQGHLARRVYSYEVK